MSKIAKALKKAQVERPEDVHIGTRNRSRSSMGKAWEGQSYKNMPVQEAPDGHLEKNRLLTDGSAQHIRDAFNVLRAKLFQNTRNKGLNSIMVTSPRRGEGKTIVAINLAMSIARDARHTALLVDTNLRWPGVAKTLGVCRGGEAGLEDYLVGKVEPSELMVNPGIENLVVLPSCQATSESADLISSFKMQQMVREFKRQSSDRYVVFDCPHLLDMPDSLVFSTYVDGVILVVEEGKTSQADIRASVEMLGEAHIIGVILNKHITQ
ncbi:AAA family ATPase [Pseudodesulfovibrio sediminis]|uniref:Uncharacterized protein n=1 Tax=Pseudodesulfovibrio sediminis TaxID=2810563 RepID=A0ABN6EVQ4_9BACT|nr:AAA family ATPase [Pseudodesulfovibrio sediminis]BCS89126.1 hypothetical protein PSDVSF_23680 [Pseudodesulfovibrio sediminis]